MSGLKFGFVFHGDGKLCAAVTIRGNYRRRTYNVDQNYFYWTVVRVAVYCVVSVVTDGIGAKDWQSDGNVGR